MTPETVVEEIESTTVQRVVATATTAASLYIGWKCGRSLYRRLQNHRAARSVEMSEAIATP